MSAPVLQKNADGEWALNGALSIEYVQALWQDMTDLSADCVKQDSKQLEIDLSQVQRVDLSGLQLLLMWMAMAKKHALDLNFVGHSADVLKAASDGGLEQALGVDNS